MGRGGGTASSPTQILAHGRPSRPDRHLVPNVYHQTCRGMMVRNLCSVCVTHVEGDMMTKRGTTLVLKDRGPRYSEAMCVTHVWLEYYCLVCRVGGVDDDMFII
jgi:hypothetical protein